MSPKSSSSPFEELLRLKARQVDGGLKKFYSDRKDGPRVLRDAADYALFPGGKRIRPVLTLLTAEMLGAKADAVLPIACGIELIHNYSLVHDDLPCMDNDDVRRGKPTVHRKFGETIAVLAGDAMLTDAFSLMARSAGRGKLEPGRVLNAIACIAAAAGIEGMIAGQAADTLPEALPGIRKGTKELLDYIHHKKTGALIEASVVAGAIAAGADTRQAGVLSRYGRDIGLAFQIIDDIMDEGEDKFTYLSLYGREEARGKAEEAVARARKELRVFGPRALELAAAARYIVSRNI